VFKWQDDLSLEHSNLYLDSRTPRELCFVSHAHADHLSLHATAIATAPTLALAALRCGVKGARALAFGESFALDEETSISLVSAGHVLGSAMLFAQRNSQSFLYTGDFKLRASLTVEKAKPVPADVLLMECTYGLPMFRFPSWQTVADELCSLVRAGMAAGIQPIVMGYSLGKAQEITRILTDAGFNVTAHGAVYKMSRAYDAFGTQLGSYRRYVPGDFHGPHALSIEERGVLVAPPQVARSAFVERFGKSVTIMMTGWSVLKNARFRYGVDHCLPLSDHADYDELLSLIEQVSPKKIFTHHGYPEFADDLQRRGLDARPARPDKQLSLFD